MIPEHPFKRLCKEILDDVAKDVAKGGMVEYRMARSAVYALQEAAEDHLVLNFESQYRSYYSDDNDGY